MKLWDWFSPDQGLSDDVIDHKFYHVEKMMAGLTDKTRRLFACDCVERVLPIFEHRFPDDDRPRNAIMVARRRAFGIAPPAELNAAYQEALAACAAASSAAPEGHSSGAVVVWPPLSVAQAAVMSASEETHLDPVEVSRVIIATIEAASGDAFQEKRWQYKQVSWYLDR